MMSWEDVTGANPNLSRFLDFLGKAEGADWDTIVGGRKFSDFSQHPNVVGLRTAEGPSTAAGRYQITGTTYRDVAPRLGITDFSPESQNRIAIELIRRGGALDDVLSGNYESAIKKLGSTWASLPSSPYSQPKRDWNFVNANLRSSSGGDDGWETITPRQQTRNDSGWEDVVPARPAAASPAPSQAPTQAPAAVAKAPASAPKKEEPRGVLRRVDDFVRGVADTVTFGYADEIAGKLDSLFGGGQSGLKTYEAAVAAQRQRDKEGGGERFAGQVVGALAPTIGVVRAVPGATRRARAGAGAATGTIQGGLYGTGAADGDLEDRLKGGAVGAGTGLILGGALSAAIPTTVRQEANRFVRRAGSEDIARLDAEIVRDMNDVFQREVRQQGGKARPSMAIDANAIANRYINVAKTALDKLDDKTVPDIDQIAFEIANRGSTPSAVLDRLQQTTAGRAVVDAMLKADRVRTLTGQQLSAGGVAGSIARIGVEASPAIISASTGVPAVVPRAMMDGVTNKLGASVPRAKVIDRLLSPKQVAAAEEVFQRLGPSRASASMQALEDLARQAQAARQTQVAAGQQASATRAVRESNPQTAISELQAKDPTYMLGLNNRFGPPRNADEMSEFSKLIRQQMEARVGRDRRLQQALGPDPKIAALRDQREPLGGAFQYLIKPDSGLNLKPDEVIQGLRILSRRPDTPSGSAAEIIRKSMGDGIVPDTNAFNALQTRLRQLRDQGVLGNNPGALSQATTASPVRNPISYAEAVRTAGAAADLARANAPSKELAQFATRVAGIKSPEAKAKAVADRLAKTTDPAEQAFLTQFVEPLAQFGKK